MADFDLVRDLLDEQLVDDQERPIGKVDGIILEMREDAPPRIAAIEVGLATLGARIHPALGRWIDRFDRWMGMPHAGWTRLPLTGLEVRETEIKLPLDGKALGLFAWEEWVRRHIVRRLPGGG